MDEALLKAEERAVFALRALYRRFGYLPFKMSKFEEYELYARNLDFLPSERVITFPSADGRLMALKPDVTLSIIKKGEDLPGVRQRLCYDESVYRPAGDTGEFREITQTGLECIGDLGGYEIAEVVCLAHRSLALVGERHILALNHLGLVAALLDETGAEGALRQALIGCLAGKNLHDLRRLAAENALPETAVETLCACAGIYGPLAAALGRLRPLCPTGAAQTAVRELEELCAILEGEERAESIVFDFSLVSDLRYYNGVVFRGYLPGAAESVLAGGQYDKLMQRMGRHARGIGFALYLDRLESLSREAREYDVDLLILLDEDLPPREAMALVRRYDDGKTRLSVQRALPPKLRCRDVLDLRKRGSETC